MPSMLVRWRALLEAPIVLGAIADPQRSGVSKRLRVTFQGRRLPLFP
jgi:hypothetical protein